MLVFKWLSVLALAALAAADITENDVPELVIDQIFVPADCKVKSKKGDKIEVHYVGTVSPFVVWQTFAKPLLALQTGKLTNGNKFDSRCAYTGVFPKYRRVRSDTYAFIATTAINLYHSPVCHNFGLAQELIFLTTGHTVGAHQVIPGWEEGLLDMCLNEKRILTIPSRKAYGVFVPTKRKRIPPSDVNSKLRFPRFR